MFLLLKRFLGRLILGWIMSLLVFMIQRAVKRMAMSSPHTAPPNHSPIHAQQPPSPPLSHGFSSKPSKQNSGQNIVVHDALWQGMPEQDLLAAYGPPVSRSSKTASCEIWTYPSADSCLTVTLENGKVLNWTD